MPDDKGITLQEAKLALAKWMLADAELAGGAQSYTIKTTMGERQLTRADATKIRENIVFWDAKVRELAGGGGIQMYNAVLPCW